MSEGKSPEEQKFPRGRRCPVCRGTGIDPRLNRRYTSGGHDDRTCPECLGECYLDFNDDDSADLRTAE